MSHEERNIHIQYVEGLISGSQADFSKLYCIYADLLYGFVLNLTKSPSLAKDVLQETFLRVWQKRESISTDMSFKSYLYTIAKNLVMDFFRKQVQNVNFDTYVENEYEHPIDDAITHKINFDDFMMKLSQAKQKLPQKQKEVFELSKENGLSISQISEELHISHKTVKNLLTLAMKTIRKELSPAYQILVLLLLKL